MEDSIYYKMRPFWDNRYVFWFFQYTSNLPKYNKWHIGRLDSYATSNSVFRWYSNIWDIFEGTQWLVKEVLKRLQFNDLYAKAEKYFFEQSSIKYLGIMILENKLQIDEKKLSGVLE